MTPLTFVTMRLLSYSPPNRDHEKELPLAILIQYCTWTILNKRPLSFPPLNGDSSHLPPNMDHERKVPLAIPIQHCSRTN
ncbi:hypothetical protein CEXT_380251 [Caerostris extrusa]|uniref:Uncharacterized protein n=1 Tax=Caerostris extrusa TaxID=172846 RepID=A0AAV4XP11_CAEEX|nr:hypothetical protein CEXT_380251 [Caerostris extrusa]